MTDWKKVYSDIKPELLDTTSSQSVVYERKDLHQEEVPNPFDEEAEPRQQWVYDEREYSKDEYEALHSPAFEMLMQNLSEVEVNLISLSLGEGI